MPDADKPLGSASQNEAQRPSQRARRAARKHRRWPWIVLAVVVVAIVGLGVWVGSRALTVKSELESAQATLTAVRNGGDVAAGVRTIAAHAANASAAADDPVWRAAEVVPWAGDNLKAARLASESLDTLTAGLAVPVLDAFDEDSETPALRRVLPVLTSAAPRVDELAQEVEAIESSPVLVGQVRSGIDQVRQVLDVASPALQLAPGMLGADGKKNYLLVAQNNAEWVGLGGSAASQSLIRVNDGDIAIARQAASQDYANEAVDVKVDKSALDLYNDVMLRRINASVSRPDFPTAAQIMKALWQRDIHDDQIDGVISIDPIALAQVLKATGPIKTSTGETVTSDNVVKMVLSDVYARVDDPDHGDGFFKEVATAIFGKIAGGDFDPRTMLSAVQTGIQGGNILFWSADPDVQARVATMTVGGVLPTDNAEQTMIGVYFRDASRGSKIDYYMAPAVTAAARCSSDGKTEFTTSVQLHLNISQANADKLPTYVQSGGWGSKKFVTEVFVYGPPSATPGKVTLDKGTTKRGHNTTDLGRPVTSFVVSLKPGETRTVTARFTGTDGGYGPLAVRTTPAVQTPTITLDDQGCTAKR